MSGAWMGWVVAARTQTYCCGEWFLHKDGVNKVLSDSTFEDITAILLEIYTDKTSKEANFTSVIFIKLPGNITFSSSTDNATLQCGIAGKYTA